MVTKDACKIEIQIELNRRMYESRKITKEVYYKVSDILIARLAKAVKSV
jgi:hypothetical protein